MLIAVSADGKDLSSAVSKEFEACRYLLLVETDTMSAEAVENTGAAELAETIIRRDCEAVLTGSFTPDIFNVLAEAMVTRYKADGLTAAKAIGAMDANKLEYIRYADENDVCRGEHSGGECNCDDHE